MFVATNLRNKHLLLGSVGKVGLRRCLEYWVQAYKAHFPVKASAHWSTNVMPWRFIDKLNKNVYLQTAQQHDRFQPHLAKNATQWHALVLHDTCTTESR